MAVLARVTNLYVVFGKGRLIGVDVLTRVVNL